MKRTTVSSGPFVLTTSRLVPPPIPLIQCDMGDLCRVLRYIRQTAKVKGYLRKSQSRKAMNARTPRFSTATAHRCELTLHPFHVASIPNTQSPKRHRSPHAACDTGEGSIPPLGTCARPMQP